MLPPLLGVPVHLQDDPDGCALACGQMVVRFITKTLLRQSDLQVLPADPVWAVSPEQLKQGLNTALAGAGSAVRYTVHGETSVHALNKRMATALNARLPAIVLTSTREHWVVVHGITSSPSTLTIHVRNPLPDREDVLGVLPLPPHADGDNCLTLDIANSGEFDGETTSCRTWARVFLVKSAHPPVLNKYVIVVPTQAEVLDKYSCPARAKNRRRLPDAASLGDFAWARLAETNLVKREGWIRLAAPLPDFAGVRQRRVADPIDAAEDFVLVELRNAAGVSALVRLDANTGEFLGAILNPSERLTTALFSRPEEVPWLRSHIPPAASTRAVWTYGKASLYSQFVPLLEVSLPGSVTYVRLFDGKVFSKLTSFG